VEKKSEIIERIDPVTPVEGGRRGGREEWGVSLLSTLRRYIGCHHKIGKLNFYYF